MEESHYFTMGDIAITVIGALFTLAFGMWAKRLDKALDLLEKLQHAWFNSSIRTERRLTRLEAKYGIHLDTDEEEEE